MKQTKILTHAMVFATLSMSATFSKASDQTDKNWLQQLSKQGIDSKSQSYCYTDNDGNVQGKNVDMKVRLASTSKLITSLWSSEVLGLDHKFNTKIYIKGNNLHIEGSNDPYLGNERMFYLVSQLNQLGYTKFDTITFDKNVMINPDVAYEQDTYPTMNAATNGANIKMYFNTAKWSADTKTEYAQAMALGAQGAFRKDIQSEVTNVQFVDKNPLAGDPEAKILTFSSPTLAKYLKQMNVKSNNYMAENLFRQIGGTKKFEQFLADQYNLTADQIHFYSGSGLPTMIDGVRKDNYATCKVMLDLVSALKTSAENQNHDVDTVVAVPGSDGGTFRNRTFAADLKNSFIAKTGTLMHTSTLAGAMSTTNGISFFGIFNQSTDIHGSKVVQNSMVESIMTDLGGPKVFDYKIVRFHAYAGSTLESIMSDFDQLEAGFSAVEGSSLH